MYSRQDHFDLNSNPTTEKKIEMRNIVGPYMLQRPELKENASEELMAKN